MTFDPSTAKKLLNEADKDYRLEIRQYLVLASMAHSLISIAESLEKANVIRDDSWGL